MSQGFWESQRLRGSRRSITRSHFSIVPVLTSYTKLYYVKFEWASQSSSPSKINQSINQSMLNRANQSMLNRANQSMLNRANQLMLNRANQSMLNRANQSMLNRADQSMLNRANQSMLNRVNQSMSNRVLTIEMLNNSFTKSKKNFGCLNVCGMFLLKKLRY